MFELFDELLHEEFEFEVGESARLVLVEQYGFNRLKIVAGDFADTALLDAKGVDAIGHDNLTI